MSGYDHQSLAGANPPRGSRVLGDERLQVPADVREFLVAKLAEMLVLDVQQYRDVPAPTGVEGRVSHRGLRLVEPGEKAG